jgi:SET domain-containing protein
MKRCATLPINLLTLINFLIHLSLRRAQRARLLRKKTRFSFAAIWRPRARFDPTCSPVVRESLIPNAGLGLFAAQRIPQGKLIVQMAPTNVAQYKCSSSDEKVTKPCVWIANSRLLQAIKRIKEGVRCQGSPDDSIVWVSREGSSFETGHYDRAVDNESIIETGACPLWYRMNHRHESEWPNVRNSSFQGSVAFFAIRDIEPGEELLWHYGIPKGAVPGDKL